MIKAVLGPEVVLTYKKLSYEPWHALAEFVDNSTQAYRDNSTALKKSYQSQKARFEVRISYDAHKSTLRVWDNAIGMDEESLQNALVIGKTPVTSWRSKYGLGLKTAASWFGNKWEIRTQKLGTSKINSITFDVNAVAQKKMNLNHKVSNGKQGEHFTELIIRQLNRKLHGQTVRKIKEYLRSMYRVELSKKTLDLYWQGDLLEWDDSYFENRLIENIDGSRAKKPISLKIGGKKVTGWAGVFHKGSRADAGFSLIQSDRVIKGWPDSYRPISLFGDQVGGSNDLVNQRLVGELVLNGFDVSHTKDQILFTDEERDELDAKLEEELSDFRQLALTHRSKKSASSNEANIDDAISLFEAEIRSPELRDFLKAHKIIPVTRYRNENAAIIKNVTSRVKPSLKVKIDRLSVKLYLVSDLSPNDPYVINESHKDSEEVIIVVNLAHPHWDELTHKQSILNYIRHCTYDGVAEWECLSRTSKLLPDTIKQIKDGLLRTPFKIQSNSTLP